MVVYPRGDTVEGRGSMTPVESHDGADAAPRDLVDLPATPAYRAWRTQVALTPSAVHHVVAGDLLRRLVVAAPEETVTRKGYLRELNELGTSMSAPTVGRAVAELKRRGFLEDGPEVHRDGRGRRDSALQLTPFVIGVSVSDAPEQNAPFTTGVSRRVVKSRAVVVHAVAAGLDGRPEASSETKPVEFHDTDSEADRDAALVRAIVDVLLEVKWEYWNDKGGGPLAGIGIMMGGQVHEHRLVHHSPNIGLLDRPLDLPARIAREVEARRADLRDTADRYKLSALDQLGNAPVLVENDADAHSRYRAWFGRSAQAETAMRYVVILLKLDGLGGAFINAGAAAPVGPFELGHMVADTTNSSELECRCGNNGCLEAVVTPRGMARQLGLDGRDGASVSAIAAQFFARVSAGDAQARRILHRAAEALGCAIANVMSLGAPEIFYIYAPEELRTGDFADTVRTVAHARAFPGVKKAINIHFEALPDHDEDAAAATAQVIDHTLRQFDQSDDDTPAGA